MGDRLILDTGVLIDAARGRLALDRVVGADDDAVLAAVTIAEYLTGVALAPDAAVRGLRQAFISDVLEVVPVEDYTPGIAVHHAELLAHVRRTGTPRGAHDLIIAATARATRRTLVTTDARARFGELPDITSRVVSREGS
ncbi:PIN domain-containing protein [Allokutzneria sp. A3M-2-11 16]|uniref:PIN domain-containing protein n=1 Tax=Allokutzneria sp. A3M-2-11 16 TaxID=2962043 RepID=UPI0020B6B938|nr:PIN domain-containing protein [Allokutzneria sp. A3M-2-11 16]MCP3797857.1 PIN domain-containing protein [Allokutzneria sp. A3M-2-11 16]